MEHIVKIRQLTKRFKDKTAVDSVSFTIQKGEITAILGPNGAGKTTAMLMMLGLIKPSSGSAEIFGRNPRDRHVRERIGVMLQDVSIIDGLKVEEVLRLFRSYYPNPLSMERLVAMTGFSGQELKQRTEKLSGGQKRRLGFALALTGNPDLLFLDEPTVGMDVASRKQFWAVIRELVEEGKSMLFTTHYLQEADDAADRVLLFRRGSIAADDHPSRLKARLSRQIVSFQAGNGVNAVNFATWPEVQDVYEEAGRMYIIADDTDKVLSRLYRENIEIYDVQVERGRLDEAFEILTSSEREGM